MLRRWGAVAVALLLSVVLFAPPASAAKSKVETARLTAKQVRERLAAVTKQLQAQEAKSQSAKQAAAAAQVRLRNARAAEVAVGQSFDQVKLSIREIAVQAYIRGGSSAPQRTNVEDIMQVAREDFIRNTALGLQEDVADELRSARQDLERKREAAETAADLAANRQRSASNALSSLRASQAEQLRLVGAAEAKYLASLKESQLASRSRRVPGSRIDLTTVRGITVATRIAANLERMLNAADADGIRLGGSGYRSPSAQVAVRKRNCGTSQYAIYEKPSSSCRPPTAKPGQSMHEQGLAIDFTYNGSVINSRSNAGYRWLKGNAARYGFYNLPSEAWHWSTNGN
ncbi:MAG: M15 family metallopeptidase [Acidimicrobiales bacterium]|nr:M15 family metallopeptidase [Acidimicrobiales bacterium]